MGGRGSASSGGAAGAAGAAAAGGGGRPEYLRETEKAVMLQMTGDFTVAPEGGFSSSMTRDVTITENVWIPKSQLGDDGIPSQWITQQKLNDLEAKAAGRFNNGRVISAGDSFYTDAKGVAFEGKQTAKEAQRQAQWAQERAQRQAATRSAAAQKAAVTRAANAGTTSSTKVSTGAAVTSTKRGTGTITNVITKSSGYVEVQWSNGTKTKEMAFNLIGSDGKPLRNKNR